MSDLPRDPNGERLELLRIDAVRAGEGTPEEQAHLQGCALCRRELAGIEEAVGRPPCEPRAARSRHGDHAGVSPRCRAAAHPLPLSRMAPLAGAALGAAAAASLAMVLSHPSLKTGGPAGEGASQARVATPPAARQEMARLAGDDNGDGRIDILGLPTGPDDRGSRFDIRPADMNHDGQADCEDIAAIARRAVALGG